MPARDGEGVETSRRPVVYDVFRPDPRIIAEIYDGVRSRVEGSRVVALGYDASGRSRGFGPWAYTTPTLVLHRRGYREVSYRRGARSGLRLVGDGQVSLIPAGYALDVDYREPCEGLVIGLADAMLAEAADELGVERGVPPLFGLEDPALLSMAEAFWHSGSTHRRSFDALGRAMSLHVLEHYAGESHGLLPDPPWLRLAIDHARRHLDRPISLEELAEVAGLSRAHFARRFKGETGLSPHDFLTRARIDRARELILEDPDCSLAAVAGAVGFCDQSHLTSHFRKAFGTTPAAFRRRPHEPTRE